MSTHAHSSSKAGSGHVTLRVIVLLVVTMVVVGNFALWRSDRHANDTNNATDQQNKEAMLNQPSVSAASQQKQHLELKEILTSLSNKMDLQDTSIKQFQQSMEQTIKDSVAQMERLQTEKQEAQPPPASSILKPQPTSRAADDDNSGQDACDKAMQTFHQLNSDYRLYKPNAAAPIYNLAHYLGQGFGRMIRQSIKACLVGLFLGRPCVIDLSTRDPDYTWRSFIGTGSYDWEIRGRISSHVQELHKAFDSMPLGLKKGNEWKSPETTPDTDTYMGMKHVEGACLRGWDVDCPFMQEEWNAANATNRHKVLLAPNFALAFLKMKEPKQVLGCDVGILESRIQHAVFQPTALAEQVHQEHLQKVFFGPNHTIGNNNIDMDYGAIHARMKLHADKKTSYEDLASDLMPCLQFYAKQEAIQQWWIMSDEPDVARYVVSNHSSAQIQIHHRYEAKYNKFVHSMRPEARARYGHANMEDSIVDWMSMYKARVSLGSGGTYSWTGSRGNLKLLDASAGTHGCGKMFQPYLSLFKTKAKT